MNFQVLRQALAAAIVVAGSLALLGGTSNAVAAEQQAGCCYSDCMETCMAVENPNFKYCHGICNEDCDAC